MILDCPTRGIDVGTKAAIYQLIMQMKEEGKSILLISEELQELIGMSDRIVLLRDGAVSGEFLRNEGLTEAEVNTENDLRGEQDGKQQSVRDSKNKHKRIVGKQFRIPGSDISSCII